MSDKKKQTSISFLKDIFLTSPTTGKRMKIKNVKAAESGLDHTEIEVGNKDEKWRFKINIEEI